MNLWSIHFPPFFFSPSSRDFYFCLSLTLFLSYSSLFEWYLRLVFVCLCCHHLLLANLNYVIHDFVQKSSFGQGKTYLLLLLSLDICRSVKLKALEFRTASVHYNYNTSYCVYIQSEIEMKKKKKITPNELIVSIIIVFFFLLFLIPR